MKNAAALRAVYFFNARPSDSNFTRVQLVKNYPVSHQRDINPEQPMFLSALLYLPKMHDFYAYRSTVPS